MYESYETLVNFIESKQGTPGFEKEFCKISASVFNTELASIFYFDPRIKKLSFHESMDLPLDVSTNFKFKPGEGICGKVFESKKPEIINNTRSSPYHSKRVDNKSGTETRSLLAVPIINNTTCYGVIELINKKNGLFSNDDLLWARNSTLLYTSHCNITQYQHMFSNCVPKQATGQNQSIIYNSSAMHKVMMLTEKVAATEEPVLILGETGTGKELIAREIHLSSSRKGKPFITVNCGSLPSKESTLLSILFGHVRGSFTGAQNDHPGLFKQADGGTLFLDEIAELPLDTQNTLLRVLENGEILPLGACHPEHVDVRIISATNKNLIECIKKGSFKHDLFYRLTTFILFMPNLRDRREDIPLLTSYFLEKNRLHKTNKICGITDEGLQYLVQYPWPGNIRELQQIIKRATVYSNTLLIDSITIKECLEIKNQISSYLSQPELLTLNDTSPPTILKQSNEFLRLEIINALEKTAYDGTGRWNISQAALELRIKRKTLEYRIRKFGIYPNNR